MLPFEPVRGDFWQSVQTCGPAEEIGISEAVVEGRMQAVHRRRVISCANDPVMPQPWDIETLHGMLQEQRPSSEADQPSRGLEEEEEPPDERHPAEVTELPGAQHVVCVATVPGAALESAEIAIESTILESAQLERGGQDRASLDGAKGKAQAALSSFGGQALDPRDVTLHEQGQQDVFVAREVTLHEQFQTQRDLGIEELQDAPPKAMAPEVARREAGYSMYGVSSAAGSAADLSATLDGDGKPPAAQSGVTLQQRLVLHCEVMRVQLDHLIDEQEKLIGLAPEANFLPGGRCSLSSNSARACTECHACDCDDGVSDSAQRTVSFPAQQDVERKSFFTSMKTKSLGSKSPGRQTLESTELSQSERPEAEAKPGSLKSNNSTLSFLTHTRHRRAIRGDTHGQPELFTSGHVAGVMDSTPGLRRTTVGITRKTAFNAHVSTFCAEYLSCHKPKVLERIEGSVRFNSFCNLAIVLNTAVLAYSAELQGTGKASDLETIDNLETCFCLFYTLELLLRMFVHRIQFVTGNDAGWHIFDGVLVGVSLLEQLSRFGMSSGTGMNVTYIRTIRVLKILKVLRVLRVMRALKDLKLLLDSILGSVKSLFWSFLVMFFTTFMFGICFMLAASHPDPTAGVPAREPWNSLSNAMSALFMAATGGLDWQFLADGLHGDGLHYYLLMFLYVGIFLFVIENALTSMFVEKLLDNVQNDETFVVQDRLDRRIEYVEKIQGLFNHMDEDGDGEVSFEELCRHLQDPRMSAFAASLDIDDSDLAMCFGIITANGRHGIDLDAFVVGCIKLRGQAKSVDIIDVCLTQTKIAKALIELTEEQQRFATFVGRQFRALQQGAAEGHGSVLHCESLQHVATIGGLRPLSPGRERSRENNERLATFA